MESAGRRCEETVEARTVAVSGLDAKEVIDHRLKGSAWFQNVEILTNSY